MIFSMMVRGKSDEFLMFQERRSEPYGHSKIGAAEAAHNGEGHPNHPAIVIEQWPTRAAGSGLRVVHNLIRQNVAHMSLRYQGTDQLPLGKFLQDELRLPAAGFDDLLYRLVSRARQNGIQPGSIPDADQGLTADRRLWARIKLQGWPLQLGKISVNERKVRIG